MKRKFSLATLFVLFLCVPAFLVLTGCGGGGGSSSSSTSGTTGTVAVLLTDGPADDFSVIEVAVTEIAIQPEDENAPWVVIFEDPAGHLFNLLDLRDQEKLLTVSDDVPAGLYTKIRMRLGDHFLVKDDAGNVVEMELKIPSGKIDLNPRGSFEVVPGQMLSITFDLDANKSINFHEAGKSGKWIFRPMVFVEIDTVFVPEDCPQILKGKINDLYTGDGGIEGFVLFLGEGRNPLDVFLAEDVVIFGEDGKRTDPDALEDAYDYDLTVHVRGWLDSEGDLQASVIVIGAVVVLKGTVDGPLDTDVFPLALDRGQIISDPAIDVTLSNDTFVMTGCDEQVPPETIQQGMTARAVGKVSITGQTLQAVAVMLKSQQITGILTALEATEGGYLLTVQVGESEPLEIFMPENVEPYMENIGLLPIDTIQTLLDCDTIIEVSIVVSSENPEMLTATDVQVIPHQYGGEVVTIYPDTGRISVDLEGETQRAYIPETALIEDQRDPNNEDPGIGDIVVGDNLLMFGFSDCPLNELDEPDFRAYMAIILVPEEPQQP